MSQTITITFDRHWKFVNAWTDDLGRRMVSFRDGADDEIIFEIVDASAAQEFLAAAEAAQ